MPSLNTWFRSKLTNVDDRALGLCEILDAISCGFCRSCDRRLMPHRLPPWQTVYGYFWLGATPKMLIILNLDALLRDKRISVRDEVG